MPVAFSLHLDQDGIALYRGTAAAALAQARPDSPDLAAALDRMRRMVLDATRGAASGGAGGEVAPVTIVLPDSQVLYTEADASGLAPEAEAARVGAALDGATPYELDELLCDWARTGDTLRIAVVARETIDEAGDFARTHGFAPDAFEALAAGGQFAVRPRFDPERPVPVATRAAAPDTPSAEPGAPGAAASADGDAALDPRSEPGREEGARRPDAQVPPKDGSDGRPDGVTPESPLVAFSSIRARAADGRASEAAADGIPADGASPDRPPGVSRAAPHPDSVPSAPPPRAPSRKGAAGGATETARTAAPAAPGRAAPPDGRAPAPAPAPDMSRVPDASPKVEAQGTTAEAAARRRPLDAPSGGNDQTTIRVRPVPSPDGLPGHGPAPNEPARTGPPAAPALRLGARGRPGTPSRAPATTGLSAASASQSADAAPVTRASEAESLTIFGARRTTSAAAGRGQSRLLGVALTGGLLAIMALVGLWSLWFDTQETAGDLAAAPPALSVEPDDAGPVLGAASDRSDAASSDQVDIGQVDAGEAAPAALDGAQADMDQRAAAAPVVGAPLIRPSLLAPGAQDAPPASAPGTDPVQRPVDAAPSAARPPAALAALGRESAPVAPAAPPQPAPGSAEPPDASAERDPPAQASAPQATAREAISEGEAEAIYALTGIQMRAPEPGPAPPAAQSVGDLLRVAVDPRAIIGTPQSLPDVTLRTVPLAVPADPLPPGSILGPDGRVVPTPEGALAPGGYALFTGRPPIIPPRRFEQPVPADEAAPEETDPAALRPRARPAALEPNDAEDPAAAEPGSPAADPAAADAPASEAGPPVEVAPGDAATAPASEALSATDAETDSPGDGATEALASLPAPLDQDPASSGPDPVTPTRAQGAGVGAPQTAIVPEAAAQRPPARPAPLAEEAAALRAAAARAEEVARAEAAAAAEALAAEEARLAAELAAASRLAVAVSLEPRSRPSNIAQIAARAQSEARAVEQQAAARAERTPEPDAPPAAAAAAPASEAPTQSASTATIAPAPRSNNRVSGAIVPRSERVRPNANSSALVARNATQRNALRVNDVTLIGIYGTASQRRALVRLPTGRYVRVGVGDRVDGGRVAAISRTELRYTKRGRDHVISMPSG